MIAPLCFSCERPKGTLNCGICEESICKNCAQFLEESTFSFLSQLSDDLKHTYYCASCFETAVTPALSSYQEILERARKVYFFFVTQKKAIRPLARATKSVTVEGCQDRDETILRLGFKAAEQGYNAIIESEVIFKKLRNEGFEKRLWSGKGLPAKVDGARIEQHDLLEMGMGG